jgi:hypothetical protein
VFGESPTTNSVQALSRIGFLAQHHPLYRHFTVADLLRFGRSCNVRRCWHASWSPAHGSSRGPRAVPRMRWLIAKIACSAR